MVEGAQKKLEEILAKKIPESIRAAAHVELGSPRETIQLFCRDNDIDLIVMATQGREGLSRFMLGSVAEATIRQSSVPVLVIPQPEG
jgi:nucleotide-binding universal stress UspA family protein